MTDTSLDIRKKRLIFRSWHRGTREADLILGRFADQNVPGFTEDQLDRYEAMLTNNDPDLYNWMTGREEPPDEFNNDIMQLLKDFHP